MVFDVTLEALALRSRNTIVPWPGGSADSGVDPGTKRLWARFPVKAHHWDLVNGQVLAVVGVGGGEF